jgi:hypothetical protein
MTTRSRCGPVAPGPPHLTWPAWEAGEDRRAEWFLKYVDGLVASDTVHVRSPAPEVTESGSWYDLPSVDVLGASVPPW